MLITQAAQVLQEFWVGGVDAALALDGLQDDRAYGIVHQGSYTVWIIELGKSYAAHQGFEGFTVVGVPGHGERSHGPAVEGVLHGDDTVSGVAVPAEGVFLGGF